MLLLTKWDGSGVEVHDELMHGCRKIAEHRLVSLVELMFPPAAEDSACTEISFIHFITDVWRIVDHSEHSWVFRFEFIPCLDRAEFASIEAPVVAYVKRHW